MRPTAVLPPGSLNRLPPVIALTPELVQPLVAQGCLCTLRAQRRSRGFSSRWVRGLEELRNQGDTGSLCSLLQSLIKGGQR